ncbi:MAG TPA: C4-type zinc ribbon domain-containing protein [Candidatus Dormibacteraeota bacterium]|nr:C4-type zinc ribbon domain-containing protein [Candidatus Dormibacteraeota bacterium]
MPPLTEQLQALVRLQDIDLLLREARDPKLAGHEARLGFATPNLGRVERARQRLASQIDDRLLQTYERMSRRFDRVVVSVEHRVCQGCRMSLPTSSASKNTSGVRLENCENCGRILYRL